MHAHTAPERGEGSVSQRPPLPDFERGRSARTMWVREGHVGLSRSPRRVRREGARDRAARARARRGADVLHGPGARLEEGRAGSLEGGGARSLARLARASSVGARSQRLGRRRRALEAIRRQADVAAWERTSTRLGSAWKRRGSTRSAVIASAWSESVCPPTRTRCRTASLRAICARISMPASSHSRRRVRKSRSRWSPRRVARRSGSPRPCRGFT